MALTNTHTHRRQGRDYKPAPIFLFKIEGRAKKRRSVLKECNKISAISFKHDGWSLCLDSQGEK